jgi:hypothetical protein
MTIGFYSLTSLLNRITNLARWWKGFQVMMLKNAEPLQLATRKGFRTSKEIAGKSPNRGVV